MSSSTLPVVFVACLVSLLNHGYSSELGVASPLDAILRSARLQTISHYAAVNQPAYNLMGKVVGAYVQPIGSGKYNLVFKGKVAPHKIDLKFRQEVCGQAHGMGAHMEYKLNMSGRLRKRGKTLRVNVKYVTSKLLGTMHGKRYRGKLRGKASVRFSDGVLRVKKVGKLTATVGGKHLSAKFRARLSRDTVRFKVRGTYSGKKFFFKYSASLCIVQLGMQVNPSALTRNYGTVSGSVNGTPFTHKFDLKGQQLQTYGL